MGALRLRLASPGRPVRDPDRTGGQPFLVTRPVCHNWGMVGRAATNPEPGLASIPSLPGFERLAPPAIAEQRRAADFETWPLTRLLADVVLRPPDLRQMESAVAAIANAPFAGSTIRRTIEALYASSCPNCGRPVTLEAMVWRPVASGGSAAAGGHGPASGSKAASRERSRKSAGSPGSAMLPDLRSGPDELLRPISREYRCGHCSSESGGLELRVGEPSVGDVKLAESVPASGDVREAMRRRFPAPRPTHPLVDQLVDLHTARQLLGLQAILARIDSEDRVGAVTAGLRLALLHAVILASRLNTSHGKPAPPRIANGVLKVPPVGEWHEMNPWLAFEAGLEMVKDFVHNLEYVPAVLAAVLLGAFPGQEFADRLGRVLERRVGRKRRSRVSLQLQLSLGRRNRGDPAGPPGGIGQRDGQRDHTGLVAPPRPARRKDGPLRLAVTRPPLAQPGAPALDSGPPRGLVPRHGLDLRCGGGGADRRTRPPGGSSRGPIVAASRVRELPCRGPSVTSSASAAPWSG